MEKLKDRPLTPQEKLKVLKQEEKLLSQQMIEFLLTNPDLSGFAKLYYRLETVREQIGNLSDQIPSSGPSPTTKNYYNQDPQGRKPYRRGKR